MKLSQRVQQTQKQTIKQMLSPKTIQMLKIFNSSYRDLVEQIQQESTENVFIDIQQPSQLEDYELAYRKSHQSQFNQLDISDFAKDDYKQNLHEFLYSQLNLIRLTDEQRSITTFLIDHIDSRGYIDSFSTLKKTISTRFNIDERKVLHCLKIIHTLEPEGVGARSLKECLLIQLEQFELENIDLFNLIKQVISHHLDALSKDDYDTIAESLSIPVEGVTSIQTFIKTNFNPNPGSNYTSERLDQHIIPSFDISFSSESGLVIKNLEQQHGIKISISKRYVDMLNDPTIDQKTKEFLTQKLEKAKDLETHLNNRGTTMNQIADYLFSKQHLFLQNGFDYLIPLLQKQLAHDLTMNPSTVSRILSSKYCRTPHGVFALKQLCPRNHFGKTAVQLKKIVAALIDEHPTLSDQKLSHLLTQQGIPMKRRTVTKYRHDIGIDSRFKRKKSEEN